MLLIVAFLVAALLGSANGRLQTAPGLPTTRVHIPGDVHIGVLASVRGSETDYGSGRCQDDYQLDSIEQTQFLIERVDEINANASILNGTKLGLTIYDFCVRDMFARAQLQHFLPDEDGNGPLYVGVLCCQTSTVTTLVSSLTTAYEIPQISHYATADALSDKTVHEFFLRTTSPSRTQADALIRLITHFNWSYVAVLYAEGHYGEPLMRQLERLASAQRPPVCIGYQALIWQSKMAETMAAVVDRLLNATDLDVIVLLLSIPQATTLFRELQRRHTPRRFVWLGGGTFLANVQSLPSDVRDVAAGLISLFVPRPSIPHLFKFLRHRDHSTDARNPWLATYFERRFGCNQSTACDVTAWPPEQRQPLSARASFLHDALMTFVHGLAAYLPTIGHTLSRFSSRDYLHALQKVKFTGHVGPIEFDQHGDIAGPITILQGVRHVDGYRPTLIGAGGGAAKTFTFDDSSVRWFGEADVATPEAVCSRPCGPEYVAIQRELACCWHCHRCHDNELPAANRSTCVACPELTWPDASRSRCETIPPDFVRHDDKLGVALSSTAAVGTAVTLATVAVFIRNNGRRLVRSSCREASYVLLTGIVVNYLLLTLLVGQPTDAVCHVFRFGFHLANTAIYASITIKIVALVTVEGIVVAVSTVLEPPAALTVMPSKTEPVVEVTCSESVLSMCMGLAFNFALIVGCAVLAFASRKLPDGYNESSQVSFCVLTSIILWLVFVPSWLTSTSSSRRVVVISIAITLNGLVNLIGLFFPKLYALYFIVDPPPRKTRETIGLQGAAPRQPFLNNGDTDASEQRP